MERFFRGGELLGDEYSAESAGQVNEELVKKHIRQQICKPWPGYANQFQNATEI
jgi:hypothetical protein